MSWSVSAAGTPSEVRGMLSQQFQYPLAESPAGLENEDEKQTVRQVFDLLEQILATFDPDGTLAISASGHMGFANWDTKEGSYQNVSLSVTPNSLFRGTGRA